MSTFDKRVQRIESYWFDVYGKGPAAQTCVAVSVSFLGLLYILAMLWMVPASLARAFSSDPKLAA